MYNGSLYNVVNERKVNLLYSNYITCKYVNTTITYLIFLFFSIKNIYIKLFCI